MISKSKKVLHVISTVNPVFGGPIQGVLQLYLGLGISNNGNISMEVVCGDAPDAPWLRDIHGIKIYALGPSLLSSSYVYNYKLIPWLRLNAINYDHVTINCIYQYQSYAVWRALRNSAVPYSIMVHGALDPWFKSKYPLKHFKKWVYWLFFLYPVFRDAKYVLYTNYQEKILARQTFTMYKGNDCVVNYGTTTPPPDKNKSLSKKFISNYPALLDKRIILFLGRFDNKKGCDLLIKAFANIVGVNHDFHLIMAGPDDEPLATKLKNQIEELGIRQHVTWTGMLLGDFKWGAIYSSEVFCLPSHTENFGIAVVEALGCGKPVIISNKVNICNDIEDEAAGIIGNDTFEGTLSSLKSWVNLSKEERLIFSDSARKCFEKHYDLATGASRFYEAILN